MKVLLIDGVDHRKVGELGLKNMVLRHHGTHEVPVNSRVKQPLSPEVWRAFLTGEWKTGVDFVDSRRVKALEFLRARIPISLGIGKKMKAEKDYPPRDFDCGLVESTGLSEFNVPYYSFDFKDSMSKVKGFLEGELSLQELNRLLRRDAMGLELALMGKSDWIAYFSELDTVQHVFFRQPRIVGEWYVFFDGVCKSLKPDLVVSDHGFNDNGMHEEPGFWSSTRGVQPKKVTDFKGIIENWS